MTLITPAHATRPPRVSSAYEAAQAVLEPLLDVSTTESPALRAAVANNLAVAVWLHAVNTPSSEQATARADALSDRSYSMYPCVLAYRSTRALILTASNRPEEALTLLQYSNYERGTAADRSHRETARAFALRRLNRNEEADRALASALRLNKIQPSW
jgi:hypothetical protein